MDLDYRELAVGRPYLERAEREPAVHDRVAEYLANGLIERAFRSLRDPARALRRTAALTSAPTHAVSRSRPARLTRRS